ncbi:amidase domain-containing protein [Virgibacillus ihumii]|uniref:amidase domain-containing protein n=1 Tax=Virgibacillus ihumii TaxID=2686091 RepID=UPI00157C8F40|nr:amidase domain-containing protein [Virgibacillus ihumii]
MEKIRDLWLDFFQLERNEDSWWERKKSLCRDREAEIVRISGKGHTFEEIIYDNKKDCKYLLHLSFLLKQQDEFIQEEQVIPFAYRMEDEEVIEHKEMSMPAPQSDTPVLTADSLRRLSDERFSYDRRAAVQYAERWWNSYNPAYRAFDVDCTNYVSQCMHAGGAPMRGAPNRGDGWWYQNDNWSYSWAVAHSLRWYLSGSSAGLKGKEMDSAGDLIPGDVICYDFQGNGRWDHNTIVVGKDAYGMPLVNAHTDNSRNRYWSYEDSRAWTPDINYKFFRIGE